MKERFSVAIDGPGGAGKGAAARAVAAHYGIHYVDTGAIYRAVALGLARAGADVQNEAEVLSLLPSLDVSVRYREDGTQETCLGGEDVSGELRTEEASRNASAVARLPQLRAFLLETQRALARRYSVVMDGRDIGTVVLPEADVKIFLTASLEARAQRRFLENREKGKGGTLDQVREDLRRRDAQDASRAVAPLRAAADAVTVDNTHMDVDETAAAICRIIDSRLAQ